MTDLGAIIAPSGKVGNQANPVSIDTSHYRGVVASTKHLEAPVRQLSGSQALERVRQRLHVIHAELSGDEVRVLAVMPIRLLRCINRLAKGGHLLRARVITEYHTLPEGVVLDVETVNSRQGICLVEVVLRPSSLLAFATGRGPRASERLRYLWLTARNVVHLIDEYHDLMVSQLWQDYDCVDPSPDWVSVGITAMKIEDEWCSCPTNDWFQADFFSVVVTTRDGGEVYIHDRYLATQAHVVARKWSTTLGLPYSMQKGVDSELTWLHGVVPGRGYP